jgi:hypothetical protein
MRAMFSFYLVLALLCLQPLMLVLTYRGTTLSQFGTAWTASFPLLISRFRSHGRRSRRANRYITRF